MFVCRRREWQARPPSWTQKRVGDWSPSLSTRFSRSLVVALHRSRFLLFTSRSSPPHQCVHDNFTTEAVGESETTGDSQATLRAHAEEVFAHDWVSYPIQNIFFLIPQFGQLFLVKALSVADYLTVRGQSPKVVGVNCHPRHSSTTPNRTHPLLSLCLRFFARPSSLRLGLPSPPRWQTPTRMPYRQRKMPKRI